MSFLADHITENRGEYVDGKENYVPFTEIGYHPNEDVIKIGIHGDYVSKENMRKYASIAEKILGDEVNIILHNDGDYAYLDSCNSRTSNCNPLEGGIRINIDQKGSCTLGFPATRGSDTGFVTAGHCGDGSVGKDVDQSSTRKIGTLVKETYDDKSRAEYCDCAFVKLTEGIPLSKEIYGINDRYYPDHKGYASVNSYVKMIGQNSGIEIGKVLSTSVSVNIQGTTFKQVVKANYDRNSGDSGGIVMQAYSGDPAYLGSHSAYKDGSSYYVKYSKFESHIGNLSWGF